MNEVKDLLKMAKAVLAEELIGYEDPTRSRQKMIKELSGRIRDYAHLSDDEINEYQEALGDVLFDDLGEEMDELKQNFKGNNYRKLMGTKAMVKHLKPMSRKFKLKYDIVERDFWGEWLAW